MSAKHHKILKVPLWFMASYSHSHSHRNISKAVMGRPHPACICSSCGGYFTCLKCLYVWLTSCLCVCVCELTPRSLSVCVCIYLGVVGPTSVLVLDLSRTVGPKPRQLCQSKTTRLCALCAVPRLPHRTLWSLSYPQWWCKCERVCVRANACGWHNNKMLVFYISI